MKKILILTALALVGITAVAAQNSSVTVRDVRNPNTLVTVINANAADAESRLTSGSTTAEFLNLINLTDAGTSYVTFQADKADDAGDKWGIVASDSAGLLIQSDKDSKGTLATKLTVGETGILTMKGSATIDNTTSASILNLTETTVAITGDGTVSGTLGVTGVATFTATPVCSAGLTVTANQTIGGTLAVTGVGTFTAESVHNAGIDADYITTDASAGIDTKSAGTLLVGASTATKVEIGDSGVTTEVQGPLTVLGSTGNGLDAAGATALYIGESTATSLVLGAADITTTVAGPLAVLQATGKGIDTTGAGALYLGEATATSVVIGASDANTTVSGNLTVSAGTITATGNGAKIWLGTNGFFQVSGGALQFVGHNGFTNALDADITQ